MAAVVIAGTVKIRPERRDDAIRAARTMAEATRAEPGCVAYRFSVDLVEPNTFHVFEEWESDEALARHFATPHMVRFQEVLPELLAGKGELRRYGVTSASKM